MARTIASATRSRRQRRRLVSDALVRVCRADPVDLPSDPDVRNEFVEAVRHHRVAPLAQVRLRDNDAAIAEALERDRDAAKATFLRSALLLDGLHTVLDDIPWVVFKGPILSERAHPVPGLRMYNDVDLLVSPWKLRDVSGRLQAAGWELADRDDMLRNAGTPGEMHWISPAGVVVDLHWSMINMAGVRQQFSVPTDELLADRARVPVGLSSAWTLSPADTLVHVCLHAALTGAHRLLLILDADQLARRIEDWDAVTVQAHRWGAAQAVALVLFRAHSFLGTPLPPDFARQLGASTGLRLVTRVIDRLSPVPALRKEASLARLVARSVRPGSFRTLSTIGRRGIQGLINRLGRPNAPLPWDDRKAADAEALEAYLRAVEDEAERSS